MAKTAKTVPAGNLLQCANLNIAIETVDLPIQNGDSPYPCKRLPEGIWDQSQPDKNQWTTDMGLVWTWFVCNHMQSKMAIFMVISHQMLGYPMFGQMHLVFELNLSYHCFHILWRVSHWRNAIRHRVEAASTFKHMDM